MLLTVFFSFKLNANPSLIQDGVPDMFTLSFSSVKVGWIGFEPYLTSFFWNDSDVKVSFVERRER